MTCLIFIASKLRSQDSDSGWSTTQHYGLHTFSRWMISFSILWYNTKCMYFTAQAVLSLVHHKEVINPKHRFRIIIIAISKIASLKSSETNT